MGLRKSLGGASVGDIVPQSLVTLGELAAAQPPHFMVGFVLAYCFPLPVLRGDQGHLPALLFASVLGPGSSCHLGPS